MKFIEHHQRKAIYAFGSFVGIRENGNSNDKLHNLVYAETGRSHISELTYDEAEKVIKRLKEIMRGQPTHAKRTAKDSPSGTTRGQQQLVWHLMYTLVGYDECPAMASLGERLCGIIKKQLHIDASPKEPFKWLNYREGSRLIEILKKYIASIEKRLDSGEG